MVMVVTAVMLVMRMYESRCKGGNGYKQNGYGGYDGGSYGRPGGFGGGGQKAQNYYGGGGINFIVEVEGEIGVSTVVVVVEVHMEVTDKF